MKVPRTEKLANICVPNDMGQRQNCNTLESFMKLSNIYIYNHTYLNLSLCFFLFDFVEILIILMQIMQIWMWNKWEIRQF